MNRPGRPSALPARRRQQRGGALTYAGSAQRIFMMRRRAESRSQELVLTAVAVTLVGVAWTLITLRIVITWVLSELLETRREHRRRERKERPSQRRLFEPPERARRDQESRRATRLLERTASAADELVPAVEAVAAAWHRGKHAASQQTAEFAGRLHELVSDVDREDVIEELQGHMVAGRLTVEELEQRVAIAHAARTRGDLDRARDRLPQSQR